MLLGTCCIFYEKWYWKKLSKIDMKTYFVGSFRGAVV
jgi:hypothetical protein